MTSFPKARSLAVSIAIAIIVALAWSSAGAQGAPQTAGQTAELTLAAALVDGSEYASAVVTARTDLATAKRDLDIAVADPSTTPLAVAAAQRAAAAAEDNLAVAIATADGDVVAAYADVLEAVASHALAAHQLDILTTTLQATRARFDAGAVTPADVSKAESDVASQQRTLQEAETDLAFANDTLAALLGKDPGTLAPITEDDLLPDESLDEVTARALEASARLKNARRSLEAAQAQLAAVDNALSSRSDIEAARTAVTTATDALKDMETTVTRDVQRAYASVTAARNRYRGTLDSVASATAELAAQQVRLTAGTISELAYSQSQLTLENSRASAASALHALLAAQYALGLVGVR